MKLQFEVIMKRGTTEVARIQGNVLGREQAGSLTLGEVVEKVHEAEEFLEKLTGLRCHINQIA